MALDDTNEVAAGGRVLIETTILDAKTGLPPDPLPSTVTCHVYLPEESGYLEDGAGQVMDSDGGGKYSTSYAVAADAPEGAAKVQISMEFADQSTDLSVKQVAFWIVSD